MSTELEPATVDLAPLYAALASAQASIRAVGKDGKNTHMHYAYTSSEAVIDAARIALAPQGLAAFRLKYDVPETSGNNFAINSTFMLVHSSGTSVEFSNMWIASPGKGRPDDKAMAGALTTGLAYWLRDLLLIPRKDDDEADRRDDRQHVQQPRQQQQQQRHRAPQEHRAAQPAKAEQKKAPKPQLSELGFSSACADFGLATNMVIEWREEAALASPQEAKKRDAAKWNDFRRGATIEKLRKAGSKLGAAAAIKPCGDAAWALFDALTDGAAGGAASGKGMEPGVEAHKILAWDWLKSLSGWSE